MQLQLSLGFPVSGRVLLLLTTLLSSSRGQQHLSEHSIQSNEALSIGYVLFPGFDNLDVNGPLEMISAMSSHYNMTLATIAHTTGLISSSGTPRNSSSFPRVGISMEATHSFDNAPPLDILIVPGGGGRGNKPDVESFVTRRAPSARYVLSVCTGAQILARAGVLNGRRATTNKAAWASITSQGTNITWVPTARWVEDGNVWTSSGVAAGLDMTYAFLKHLFGTENLDSFMGVMEYAPHVDPHWDPFSLVYNVPGANKSSSLVDCTGPVQNHSETMTMGR